MEEDRHPELQRNVQRLLGRCLLRIQQYERLMKAMLAGHELAGSVESLDQRRAARVEKFSDKSLGMLVKSLLETCVVPEGFTRDPLAKDEVATDRISMSFSHRLLLPQEKWAKTKADIEELVGFRNTMAHQLIEHFDLVTEEGCVAAIQYLEEGYERIDRHFGELAGWASSMRVAQETLAALSQTEVFRAMLVDGVALDGSFDLPHIGIVRALREAVRELGVDGWASLDEARRWVMSTYPEQTPAKYGYRTWPQVIQESRQFELRYRFKGGERVPWYRCRA